MSELDVFYIIISLSIFVLAYGIYLSYTNSKLIIKAHNKEDESVEYSKFADLLLPFDANYSSLLRKEKYDPSSVSIRDLRNSMKIHISLIGPDKELTKIKLKSFDKKNLRNIVTISDLSGYSDPGALYSKLETVGSNFSIENPKMSVTIPVNKKSYRTVGIKAIDTTVGFKRFKSFEPSY